MYEKRLVATIVSSFTVGVAVGIFLNNRSTLVVCAIFAILAVVSLVLFAVLSKSNKFAFSKRITAAALAVAALSFGVLRVCATDVLSRNLKIYDKCEDTATVKIQDVNSKYVDATILDSELCVPKFTKVRLYTTYYNEELSNGDVIYCELKYSYDKYNSLRSKGISLTSSVNITDMEKGSGLLYSIRESVDKNNNILFEKFGNAAGISKGVTIGDRSEMSSYVFAVYRNSGISHLLAISGLHVSIIVLSFYNLLTSLSVKRQLANCIAIFVALLFAALTGFSVGALRSAIMICFVMAFGLFLRKSDSITALFFSLLLFLVINPYSICSVGLQLSFVCTLGILLISPLLEELNFKFSLRLVKSKSLGRKVIYKVLLIVVIPLVTSLVSSVFSFPVAFLNFNTTSAIAPFINILAIPLFTLAVELSVIAFLLAPLSIGLASLCSYPAGALFQITTSMATAVYNSNIGVISVRTPIMIIPLFIALTGIGLIIGVNRNRNAIAISSFALFSVLIFICGFINGVYDKINSTIEYGNNEGEYVFCSTKEENLYIDVGGYVVNPDIIYETGTVHLDNYVVLKFNSRAYQHIDYMTSEIKVEKLLLPYARSADDVFWLEKIKVLANERSCDIIQFDEDCELHLSNDAEIEIVEDVSNYTTVFMKFGKHSIQFLGDKFANKAICDYAIVTDDCETKLRNIDAETIYVQNGYADEEQKMYKFFTFDNRIKLIIEESGCSIYEP